MARYFVTCELCGCRMQLARIGFVGPETLRVVCNGCEEVLLVDVDLAVLSAAAALDRERVA